MKIKLSLDACCDLIGFGSPRKYYGKRSQNADQNLQFIPSTAKTSNNSYFYQVLKCRKVAVFWVSRILAADRASRSEMSHWSRGLTHLTHASRGVRPARWSMDPIIYKVIYLLRNFASETQNTREK